MNSLEHLIKIFSSLPGIGRKSASRIAYYILKKDKSFAESLSTTILEMKESIINCSICGNYTENDPCDICRDPKRDPSVLCVVEQPQDVQIIESTGEFRGRYHVLGGAIAPIDGVGPGNLTFDALVRRVEKDSVRELILATNPTVEGDTTALYAVKLFKDKGIACTRLASGIPVGGDLEYADTLTLARSLKGRIPYTF